MNQFGRRNLTLAQRVELALLLEPLLKKQNEEKILSGKHDPLQNSGEGIHLPRSYNWTDHIMEREAGVSHDTIHKYKRIKKDAIEPIQEIVVLRT